MAGLRDHDRGHGLDPFRVRHADDRHFRDALEAIDRLFDLALATFSPPLLIMSFLRSTTVM